MNQYSEQKFKELKEERRVRILLDWIYKIEAQWQEKGLAPFFETLENYFKWCDFFESQNSLLNRLSNFQFKISPDMSLRHLLDLAVPMERYLNQSIKDEHMIPVRKGDSLSKQKKSYPLFFVLDHLRSAFNVGSLFRTAECLGVRHIYLIGYTPTPDDKGVQKTAMGTENLVSWSSHHHMDEVLEILEKKNIPTMALETVEGSVPLDQFLVPESLALIVGNERFGLMNTVLEQVDGVVEIPMMGSKNSLNVANSLSIASFEVIRQWNTH